jgi:hypothetical protein
LNDCLKSSSTAKRAWLKKPDYKRISGKPICLCTTNHLRLSLNFLRDEANNALPVTDFEDQLFSHIQKNSKLKAQRKRRLWVIGFSGIAACLLLAVGLFMQYKPAPIEDSFNDPALAYQEIQKALFFVSEKLNMGIKPTQKAASDLNEGLEQASRISKLYEVQNFFIIE